MLILTRKKGQSLILGNNIEIFVSAVDGDQVKLGIIAPKDVAVLRKEVYESVQRTNREAVSGKLDLSAIKKMTKTDQK